MIFYHKMILKWKVKYKQICCLSCRNTAYILLLIIVCIVLFCDLLEIIAIVWLSEEVNL